MATKRVSVAEAKRHLPRLLKESADADILVFNERRGVLAGVIVSAENYEHVSRARAYLDALRISDRTRNRRLRVSTLIRGSRSALETRGRRA